MSAQSSRARSRFPDSTAGAPFQPRQMTAPPQLQPNTADGWKFGGSLDGRSSIQARESHRATARTLMPDIPCMLNG